MAHNNYICMDTQFSTGDVGSNPSPATKKTPNPVGFCTSRELFIRIELHQNLLPVVYLLFVGITNRFLATYNMVVSLTSFSIGSSQFNLLSPWLLKWGSKRRSLQINLFPICYGDYLHQIFTQLPYDHPVRKTTSQMFKWSIFHFTRWKDSSYG